MEFVKSFLLLLKVESIENPTLQRIFNLKKEQLKCSTTQKMLQLIPAHFCDVVCRIGFQAELAPPDGSFLCMLLFFIPTSRF